MNREKESVSRNKVIFLLSILFQKVICLFKFNSESAKISVVVELNYIKSFGQSAKNVSWTYASF